MTIDTIINNLEKEDKALAEELKLLISKGRAYDQVRWERNVAENQLKDIGCSLGQNMDSFKKAIKNPLASFANLFTAYNKEENFKILICAQDEDEAEKLAEGYRIDAKMTGKFIISEPQTDDRDNVYNCDYIISSGDDQKNLINREDYVAVKLWNKDDIRGVLIEEGYEGTDEEVNAVVDSGELRALNDCTDDEWNLIRHAVVNALKKNY